MEVAFSFQDFSFPGSYEDGQGRESIAWRVAPTDYEAPIDLGWPRGFEVPSYEFHTVIRGIHIRGVQFDGLEPDLDPACWPAALSAGLTLDRGVLGACTLTGDLPCSLSIDGDIVPSVVSFRLELPDLDPKTSDYAPVLRLATTVRGERFEVTDDVFGGGIAKLEQALPPEIRLVCCFTCHYSDYFPDVQGLMGMACCRGAKKRYLALRGKDFYHLPVTEFVMETYLCPEYRRRSPGTGYRG